MSDVLPPLVRDRAWKLGFHAPLPAYVAALDEPLRAGHAAALSQLPGGPAWSSLLPPDRWRWGVLGAYLEWVKAPFGLIYSGEFDRWLEVRGLISQ